MAADLRLEGLAKRYGATIAVADLDLVVAPGEAVALLGPSGCGKTTTLRMVAGLIAPDAGRVTVAGEDVTRLPAHRRDMGYVFQSYALFPHMDVAANVAFGLVERGVGRAERDRKVAEALALVRLDGLADRRPRQLSGGQQQRVALARALVVAPRLLLLDESLSNLDSKLRDAMRQEIRDIQRRLGITTLFVTHDQIEAFTMCDRIAVMEAGRIAQIDSPRAIYDRPRTRFVADFVGRGNRLALVRTSEGFLLGGHAITVEAPPDAPAIELFLRPQHLTLIAADAPVDGANRLPGRVRHSVFVGERLEVVVDTPAGQVIVEPPAATRPPADGTDLAVVWSADQARVFAAP
jgi:putative spermidine/putrescine transport system ATP-binding protein